MMEWAERTGGQLPERIWRKIDKNGPLWEGTPCWIPAYSTTSVGYVQVWLRNKPFVLHRVLYELYGGPIPPGLQIDHLCRRRNCCNPVHLEAVTPSENVRRSPFRGGNAMRKKQLVCCARGHAFTPDNTYVRVDGRRTCRACVREWRRMRVLARGQQEGGRV